MKEVKNKKKCDGWVEKIIREIKKKTEYNVWTAIMSIVPFSIIYILLEMINLKFGVDDQLLTDLMVSLHAGIIGFFLYVILHKFKASSIIKVIVLILLVGGFMGFVRYKYQFCVDKELNEKSKEELRLFDIKKE